MSQENVYFPAAFLNIKSERKLNMIKKAIIPFISVLFFSYLSAQGFQFSQTIMVDDNQGNFTPELTFGFSPDYTDGYDNGYCSE